MNHTPNFLKPANVSQSITTSTGASAAAANAFGIGTHCIRVVATTNAWVMIAPGSPVAAVGAGVYLPANVPEYFSVAPGASIAAIADAGAGKVYVAEMTR
jgi:hypothetical protein